MTLENIANNFLNQQPIIVNHCQVCKKNQRFGVRVLVGKNRQIASCLGEWCRQKAHQYLEKECLVCQKWLFGQETNFPETCSIACQKKYEISLNQERIIYHKNTQKNKRK